MRLIFFITLPAMVGLIILREPIVALLFGRGAFGTQSVQMTAYALLFYGVGLWAFSAVRILVAAFYAIQDTKTPVKMATISIFANIGLGVALMGPLSHGGLALATSLASMLNFGLLTRALHQRLGAFPWKKIIVSTGKSVVSSMFMGGVLFLAIRWFPPDYMGSNLKMLVYVFVTIAAGILTYGISSLIFQRNELKAVTALVKR